MTEMEMVLHELKNHYDILQQLAVNQDNMQKHMLSMENRMVSMENRMVSIENEVKGHNDILHQLVLNQESMQKRVMSIEKDVAKLKITMETEVSPAIRTLTELHLDTSQRLIKLENNVQNLDDNAAIDEVIRNINMG